MWSGVWARARAFSQSELPRKPPIDTHGRYTCMYNTCTHTHTQQQKKSERRKKSEKRHPWGAFHQAFCQCFSLTTVISYWNPCIWLAESKFFSEKYWQNAWWNAPLVINMATVGVLRKNRFCHSALNVMLLSHQTAQQEPCQTLDRFTNTVEPRYNEVLGTMKITLLYQVSHYIRVKKQRNI